MEGDSRVVAKQKEWISCMNARGYAVKTWAGGADEAHAVTDNKGGVSVAFTRTDAKCSQKVNLAGTMYAVDSAYQTQWLDTHGAEIQEVSDGYAKGLAKATSILAGR
ncbi:hypothetical protein [Acidipropionibacterium timonense]|uniref:hypothetical protein n=1 Tax=Acidipropionibacterium timonense TaxID=2161818 RepID=UPI0010314BF9|nr:hypothetical protein [Acidipropionibacterium timonense]